MTQSYTALTTVEFAQIVVFLGAYIYTKDIRDTEDIRNTKYFRDTKNIRDTRDIRYTGISGTPKISRIPGIYGIQRI